MELFANTASSNSDAGLPKPLCSVVVPVFNSEKTLLELHRRLSEAFAAMGVDFELVLVEDGGADDSWRIMQSIRRRDPRVRIIRLTRNFGQHHALLCGLSIASGDFVVTMDDDLQHPPEEIPKLLASIKEQDWDIVYGLPKRRNHPTYRNIGAWAFRKIMTRVLRSGSGGQTSSFRIMRHLVARHLVSMPTSRPCIGLMCHRVTQKVGYVTVAHASRQQGESTYNLSRLVGFFLDGVLHHSDLPLKVVFGLGVGSVGLSAILGTTYLVRYLMGLTRVSGWTTLVLLLLFFSGIIMFSMGMVGEYLIRIMQEVRHVPAYLIRDKEI